MKIRWNQKKRVWLVYDSDISDFEWRLLSRAGQLPTYHDNTSNGDTYIYHPDKSFAPIISKLLANNQKVEIIINE